MLLGQGIPSSTLPFFLTPLTALRLPHRSFELASFNKGQINPPVLPENRAGTCPIISLLTSSFSCTAGVGSRTGIVAAGRSQRCTILLLKERMSWSGRF